MMPRARPNRYAYARDNPLSYRDPLGLQGIPGVVFPPPDLGTGAIGNGQGPGYSPGLDIPYNREALEDLIEDTVDAILDPVFPEDPYLGLFEPHGAGAECPP